ncbi:MAG: hypothetical protein AAF615_08915, partial [Pseudomonadota bacterium]
MAKTTEGWRSQARGSTAHTGFWYGNFRDDRRGTLERTAIAVWRQMGKEASSCVRGAAQHQREQQRSRQEQTLQAEGLNADPASSEDPAVAPTA